MSVESLLDTQLCIVYTVLYYIYAKYIPRRYSMLSDIYLLDIVLCQLDKYSECLMYTYNAYLLDSVQS